MEANCFTMLHCFCHTTTWISHMYIYMSPLCWTSLIPLLPVSIFSVWLTSVSIMPSKSIHVAVCKWQKFIRFYDWIDNNHIFFICSSGGHLGCFCVLTMIFSAAVNIGVHVSLQMRVFLFSDYLPKSRIAGSYQPLLIFFEYSYFALNITLTYWKAWAFIHLINCSLLVLPA